MLSNSEDLLLENDANQMDNMVNLLCSSNAFNWSEQHMFTKLWDACAQQ